MNYIGQTSRSVKNKDAGTNKIAHTPTLKNRSNYANHLNYKFRHVKISANKMYVLLP